MKETRVVQINKNNKNNKALKRSDDVIILNKAFEGC